MDEVSERCPVNLLVTVDKNYLSPLINMLDSYARVHEGVETHVYIAHSELERSDFGMIRSALDSLTINVHDVRITETWFSDTPVLARLNEESFYRVMAFEFLPKTVKRCLYLDPDIYIKKSILPLYQIDMEGCCIAAAGHLRGVHDHLNRRRLGLKEQRRYINSGVMLMDLERIREECTVSKVLDCMNEHSQRLLLGDQDLINLLFDGRIKTVDECVYNLDEHTRRCHRRKVTKSFIEHETAIIHYNGKYKPWLDGYRGRLDKYYPYDCVKGPAPIGKWKDQAHAVLEIVSPIEK